jgi:hypothetical protein
MTAHQLVLQFAGAAVLDLDALIEIEDALIDRLGVDVVDGHDVGATECNIFLSTVDPAGTFELAKPVLEERQLLGVVVAAHRPVDDDRYHVIWPANYDRPFTVL